MTIINAAKIFSTLGNPNSLWPIMGKDLSAMAGMTTGSFITGKEEGQDRFIDELGTSAIWIGSLPISKFIYDNTVIKACGLDASFDARNFNDKSILKKIQEHAPTQTIKNNIEDVIKKESLYKKLTTAKFFITTAFAVASYMGLTKFKQNYTEKKIRENLIAEYSQKKTKEEHQIKEENSSIEKNNLNSKENVNFKGLGPIIEQFAFSPVKNMWILDGFITEERLRGSRSLQEFIGYSIKEGATIFFMFFAGNKIQQSLEEKARKNFNKNIGLDARVIENGFLKDSFDKGTIQKSLDEFKNANKSKAELYEFLIKNPENLVVKSAKLSDLIECVKDTELVDTRKYIDLVEVEQTYKKLDELYAQYKSAIKKGDSSEKFFKELKKLKRHSILTNIGTCVFALGVATPAIMLAKRFLGKGDREFQTKKQIREQLIKDGIIA